MPMVEIDENELVQARNLRDTINKMMGNPTARKKILEAQKLLNPDAVIPELDAAKPINDAVEKLNTELSAFRKEMADDKSAREEAKKLSELNSRWEKGRSSLRAEGYTDEGIAKVEKLMEERGIADHDAGAALFDRLNPPEVPVAPQNSGFDVLMNNFTTATGADEASRKALFDNPDGWLNGEVSRTLNDFRNGKK